MRFIILTIANVLIFAAGFAGAQVKLGAIGDSLIDEHFDQTGFGTNLGYSQNALELLIITGRVDSGPLGNWGGTRGNGYEYNWALAGATTTTLIEDEQHINLAAQIPVEGISTAVMVVGSNDLFPFAPIFPDTGFPGSSYEAIYEGFATPEQIDAIASAAVANVVLAAQALQATGVDLVVGTAPDYGISPFCKFQYPDAVKRELVDDVIEEWNSNAVVQLNAIGIPVIDLYTLTKDIWGDHGFENSIFVLGGAELDLNGTGGVNFEDVFDGTYDPDDVTSDTVDAFVHDGIHPNTSIGGIFANLAMTAFNQQYCNSFTLFTEQEILENGGPDLGAMYTEDTFEKSLGGKTYTDYVIAPKVKFPLGDVNRDGEVNLLDVDPFVNLLSSGMFKPEADINLDGMVNLLDVDPFVTLLIGG